MPHITKILQRRTSGIFLHPTSLPSHFGIGDFGPAAYRFIDFLADAGQSLWQVLPLVLPDSTGSPYASSSAFAGNWLLISPERLVADGLLESAEGWSGLDEPVHYPLVGKRKAALFEQAFRNFQVRGESQLQSRFRKFRSENRFWLEDVALFSAIKEHFGFAVPWTHWPVSIRRRRDDAIFSWRKKLKLRIEFYAFLQWLYDVQWRALKRYANRKGISVVGDVAIYVTRDSADTWADPKNFWIDSMGRPRLVAGVPPDYFSSRGQVWGNPLYKWDHLQRENFLWWIRRFRRSFDLYDIIRLDHFRGYLAAWGIRPASRSARQGSWQAVPGQELFRVVKRKMPQAEFIAEDLGIITEDVNVLRNQLGFPGVRVLQFGFDRLDSLHTIVNLSRRSVAYTGTHDNNTTRGWLTNDATRRERKNFVKVVGGTRITGSRRLLEALFRSRVNTVIVPLSDFLNYGTEARFNTPGTRKGNWQWRMRSTGLTPERAAWLRRLTRTTGRML